MGDFSSAPGSGWNFQVGRSGVLQPSYFGQPNWPGVNVDEMQSELGFPGAPMMGGIPNMAPSTGAIPELDLSLDFLADLPKADLPFELNGETLALLGRSDDFTATLEGLWNGEPQGQSFSWPGALNPENGQEEEAQEEEQEEQAPTRRRLAGKIAGRMARAARKLIA